MHTLLIIGGALEAIPGLIKAREMGIRLVVSDQDPDAPGFAFADDTLLASTYDIEKTVAEAKCYHEQNNPISGVICIATDVPLTVATVAQELGLPGIPINSARLAMDKLAMKEQFFHDGIPVPWYTAVASYKELENLCREKTFPLVIKPVDSRGARGVLLLTSGIDLHWAFETALKFSPTGRVMVERFLPGPQVSTESLVIEGVTYTPGFSDRNYKHLKEYLPHIIENGGELPSFLTEDVQTSVRNTVARAAKSLGIVNGVVKGDIVVHQDQPYVIELAARLSGGYFCTHEIPLNTGVDLVGAAIRQALGDPINPVDLKPKYQRPVAQRYLFPSPGVVTSVQGLDRLAGQPEVAYLEVRVKPGDYIGPVDSHPARAGVVITTGETCEAAVDLAEHVVNNVLINTE
jgi:biotin carboxylase